MNKLITSLLLLPITLAACTTPEMTSTPETTPTPSATETVPQPPPTPPPPPEPEPDWPSSNAYLEDALDSMDSIGNLLNLTTEFMDLIGTTPDEDVAELYETAARTITTHIDHFEGTTPPPEFVESQRYFLEGWNYFKESWMMLAAAVRSGNASDVMQATEVMDRGTAKIHDATEALPN